MCIREEFLIQEWILFFARCLWRLDSTFFKVLLYHFSSFTKGYDYKKILAKIHCPILFIRGEARLGAVMTDDEIFWLKQNFRNVSFAQIIGAGRLLHLQEQGQTSVLKEMVTFLECVPIREKDSEFRAIRLISFLTKDAYSIPLSLPLVSLGFIGLEAQKDK